MITNEGSEQQGQLTAITPEGWTLAAEDQTRLISLADVEQIKFKGEVWLLNPDGKPERTPWRGAKKTVNELPQTALIPLKQQPSACKP